MECIHKIGEIIIGHDAKLQEQWTHDNNKSQNVDQLMR